MLAGPHHAGQGLASRIDPRLSPAAVRLRAVERACHDLRLCPTRRRGRQALGALCEARDRRTTRGPDPCWAERSNDNTRRAAIASWERIFEVDRASCCTLQATVERLYLADVVDTLPAPAPEDVPPEFRVNVSTYSVAGLDPPHSPTPLTSEPGDNPKNRRVGVLVGAGGRCVTEAALWAGQRPPCAVGEKRHALQVAQPTEPIDLGIHVADAERCSDAAEAQTAQGPLGHNPGHKSHRYATSRGGRSDTTKTTAAGQRTRSPWQERWTRIVAVAP